MAKKLTLKEIEAALLKAAGIKKDKGEEEQSYLSRLVKTISGLGDPEWDAIPGDAQQWYNAAASARNKKQTIEGFGDAEDEPVAERKSSRAKVEEDEPAADTAKGPEVGDNVTVTLKGGTVVSGVITELDEKNIVLEVDGEEDVHRMSKVESIVVNGAADTAGAAADDLGDPEAGDTVEITKKDGEIVTGEFVEQDDKNVVFEVEGEEEVLRMSKVEKVVVTAKAEKKTKPAAKTAAKAATKPAAEKAEAKPAAAKKVAAKPDADKPIPATVAARRMVCEHLDWDREKIGKALEKAGVEIKGATLDITYSDAHRTIAILKELGKLAD